MSLGNEQELIPCPDWMPGDLPHDRAAASIASTAARWTASAGGSGAPWSYSQFHEPQIPNYYRWAKEYALSDNFFASAMGPSYPNHYFYVAGQSGGVIDNPENIDSPERDEGRDGARSRAGAATRSATTSSSS